MNKLMKFIYFNAFTYIVYMIIDKIFMVLHLFSNEQLGQDLLVVPTSTDMLLIFINVMISSATALYLMHKFNLR